MSDAAESGANFEKEVANIYRMLGYDVDTNLDFEGFQVDITARRRVPGADETNLIIECKFKSSGSVSNAELGKLSNIFTEAAREQGFHKAVMVTNRDFSASAKAFAAGRSHLVLKTTKDLEAEILDLSSAYGRYKREYLRTAISSLYVPLRAQGHLPGESQDLKIFENLESSLEEWVDNGRPGFLTIMADFGSGKTTLLERLKFRYCDLYERGKSVHKPLLLRAKELHKYRDINEFLMSAVVAEFRSAADINIIWRFIEEGQFLLLIDGFDEVAQQVDPKQRHSYFVSLSALFNSGCRSIMTCRPTFFVDKSEYDNLVDGVLSDMRDRSRRVTQPLGTLFIDDSPDVARLAENMARNHGGRLDVRRIRGLSIGRLDLLPFTEQQIDIYLSQHNDEFLASISNDWQKVKEFLYTVYDIKDLMKHPILLDMITRTVLSRQLDVNNYDQRLGAADIYEAYLRALLDREYLDRETRRLLSSQARQSLLEIVALTLFRNDAMDASFHDVLSSISSRHEELVVMHPELRDKAEAHVVADIILTGFLAFDGDNRFRFAHKSFMEYLLARFLVKKIAVGIFDDLGSSALPPDIVYFLGSFLINDRAVFNQMARYLRREDGRSAGWCNNIARALVSSDAEMEDFSLNDASIDYIATREIRWISADIKNVVFNVRDLENQRYQRCTFDNVEFKGATGRLSTADVSLLKCRLVECDLKVLDIHTSSGEIEIEGGKALHISIQHSELRLSSNTQSEKISCHDSIISVHQAMRSSQLEFDGSKIEATGPVFCTQLSAHGSELKFREVPRLLSNANASGSRSGRALSISLHDSYLEIPAFSGYETLKTSGLSSNLSFVNSRIAGFIVEEDMARADLWRGCEGVVFFEDRRRRFAPLKRRHYNIGNVTFISREEFLRSPGIADEALRQAEKTAGSWLSSWISHAKAEVAVREKTKSQQAASAKNGET